MQAMRLLQQGLSQAQVARIVGVTPPSVQRWKEMMQRDGANALKAKPHPGGKARLSHAQLQQVGKLLERGARSHGYVTELWTLKRVAEVIERHFGVRYHPSRVWVLLRRLGWSAQKPERRARQQDAAVVEQWRNKRWPHIKKGKRAGRAHRLH